MGLTKEMQPMCAKANGWEPLSHNPGCLLVFTHALLALWPQVELLEEMESHSNRTMGAAEVWASEQEDAFTEALDGQLRSHRPRAGRVEEEVRATRSVELLAQRRIMEGHMRLQSKAVKQQQVWRGEK
jgi:hypothetical protein